MKKLLAIILFLTFCYILASYGQRGETVIRRGGGGLSATNTPGNGLFLTGVTNGDGSVTLFYAAISATATNAQAPSMVLSNLVVTVAKNVTNAHANIGTISVGTLYPNAVLSNLVVNVANTVTNAAPTFGVIVDGILYAANAQTFTGVLVRTAFTNLGQTTLEGDTLVNGELTLGNSSFINGNVSVGNFSIISQGPFSNALWTTHGGLVTNRSAVRDLAGHIVAGTFEADGASDFSGNVNFNTGDITVDSPTTSFNSGVNLNGQTFANGLITFTLPAFITGTQNVAAITTFSNQVAHRPFTVPNNIGVVNGTNGNLQMRILTNSSTLSFVEMGDGQTIELLVTNRFETNILSFTGLSNTNFMDGFYGSIPSNRLVKFFVQRVGTHTNISYQGPVVELLAGGNITFTTNTDTSITIAATGAGSGDITGGNANQFTEDSGVLTIENGALLTNISIRTILTVPAADWVLFNGVVSEEGFTNRLAFRQEGISSFDGEAKMLGVVKFGNITWFTNTINALADIDVTGAAIFRTNLTGLGTNNFKWVNITNSFQVAPTAAGNGRMAFVENGTQSYITFDSSSGPGSFTNSFPMQQNASLNVNGSPANFHGSNIINTVNTTNEYIRKNTHWISGTLTAVSQQTNVIIDFSQGVWEAGNWTTNLNFLHATNGTLGLSETPTNHYSSIKIQPPVTVRLRFPTTFNLLNFTNNCGITNGFKGHLVFTSNGSSQTNVDVALMGTLSAP